MKSLLQKAICFLCLLSLQYFGFSELTYAQKLQMRTGIVQMEIVDYRKNDDQADYRRGKTENIRYVLNNVIEGTVALDASFDWQPYLDKNVLVTGEIQNFGTHWPEFKVSSVKRVTLPDSVEFESNASSVAPRKTAIVIAKFTDTPDTELLPSQADIRQQADNLRAYEYQELRSKYVLQGSTPATSADIFGPVQIAFVSTGCASNNDAKREAAIDAAGIRGLYDDTIVLFAHNDCPWAAIATMGKLNGTVPRWMTGDADLFWAIKEHEFGHWIGLWHAISSTCFGTGTGCLLFTQGNDFTPMGNPSSLEYSMSEKTSIGIIDLTSVADLTGVHGTTVSVSVWGHRNNPKGHVRVQNISIQFATGQFIELGYERSGLVVMTSVMKSNGVKETTIVDNTPQTPNNSTDGLLLTNQSVTHSSTGIRVKNLGQVIAPPATHGWVVQITLP